MSKTNVSCVVSIVAVTSSVKSAPALTVSLTAFAVLCISNNCVATSPPSLSARAVLITPTQAAKPVEFSFNASMSTPSSTTSFAVVSITLDINDVSVKSILAGAAPELSVPDESITAALIVADIAFCISNCISSGDLSELPERTDDIPDNKDSTCKMAEELAVASAASTVVSYGFVFISSIPKAVSKAFF